MAFIPPVDPEDLICPQCRGPKTKQARRCAKCSGEGHTPEQRDLHALCGAKKRDGSRCRAFVGQGTDHSGVGVCRWHGGATSAHRQHAVAIEARRRMATMGTPIEDVTAPSALMGLLRASAGHVAWLQQEVAALDSLAGHEAAVIVQLYDNERKMLLQVGEACIRVLSGWSQVGGKGSQIRLEGVGSFPEGVEPYLVSPETRPPAEPCTPAAQGEGLRRRHESAPDVAKRIASPRVVAHGAGRRWVIGARDPATDPAPVRFDVVNGGVHTTN